MQNDSELFEVQTECPICNVPYNMKINNRQPLIVCFQFHGMCKQCLIGMNNRRDAEDELKCPYCRQVIIYEIVINAVNKQWEKAVKRKQAWMRNKQKIQKQTNKLDNELFGEKQKYHKSRNSKRQFGMQTIRGSCMDCGYNKILFKQLGFCIECYDLSKNHEISIKKQQKNEKFINGKCTLCNKKGEVIENFEICKKCVEIQENIFEKKEKKVIQENQFGSIEKQRKNEKFQMQNKQKKEKKRNERKKQLLQNLNKKSNQKVEYDQKQQNIKYIKCNGCLKNCFANPQIGFCGACRMKKQKQLKYAKLVTESRDQILKQLKCLNCFRIHSNFQKCQYDQQRQEIYKLDQIQMTFSNERRKMMDRLMRSNQKQEHQGQQQKHERENKPLKKNIDAEIIQVVCKQCQKSFIITSQTQQQICVFCRLNNKYPKMQSIPIHNYENEQQLPKRHNNFRERDQLFHQLEKLGHKKRSSSAAGKQQNKICLQCNIVNIDPIYNRNVCGICISKSKKSMKRQQREENIINNYQLHLTKLK